MFDIRPFAFDDEDYAFLATVQNAVLPDLPVTVSHLRRADRDYINPDHLFHRFIVQRNGKPIGYGEYGHTSWSYRPDKYHAYVAILPERRQQGAGTYAFAEAMERLLERAPKIIESSTREDQAAAARFLKKRGFSLAARAPMSILNPATFDPEPFAAYSARAAAAGIRLTTLRQLMADDPDHRQKLYDLEVALEEDLPWYDAHFTPLPFDRWQRATFENPDLRPDGFIIAVADDAYVGVSALWGSQATDEKVYTGLTGVRREYRRRGVAVAMKVKSILWAKGLRCQNGAPPLIHTENEENNPMYQINMRLGYVPQPAWVTYTRVYDETWQES